MTASSSGPSSRRSAYLLLHALVTVSVIALAIAGDLAAQTPPLAGRVKLTFDDLPTGTVLSKCVGAGTLPSCVNGKVENVYPGVTFYSAPGIQSGPLNNNQVVVVKLPPVPASFAPAGSPPTIPPPSSTNVACAQAANGNADCRGHVLIKFSSGVTKLAYTVAAGYDVRCNFCFGDDFNSIVTYGPSGLQIQQNFASMFFVWNRFMNLSTLPLTNITGFELLITNSHIAQWGMGGPAPAGLGGGLGLDSIEFTAGPSGLCADTNLDGVTDDDEDGLCDNWEVFGIDANQDGKIDLVLPGANPRHKDLYYELDYMADGSHTHAPNADALARVVAAFAQAPAASVNNPDGLPGVTLHLEVDDSETVEEHTLIELETATAVRSPTFQDLKQGLDTIACDGQFGTRSQRLDVNCEWILKAKFMSHRYGMFAHTLAIAGIPRKNSGQAEIGGNDFVVTMGDRQGTTVGWNALWEAVASLFGTSKQAESVDTIAAVLMHEIGHTLGLHHGAYEDTNCKPNYMSIMSYSRMINGAGYTDEVPSARKRIDRDLDFSRSTLPQLDESKLDENAGVGGTAGVRFLFGRVGDFGLAAAPRLGVTGQPIDWDGNHVLTAGAQQDISFFKPSCDDPNFNGSFHQGQDDWHALSYSIQDKGNYAGGGPAILSEEQTNEDYINLSLGSVDEDGDGVDNPVDNCVLIANSNQLDTDADGVGDACESGPPANKVPVANAGPDQTVEGTSPNGAQVNLSGLASTDPDGDVLTYEWSGPFGKLTAASIQPTLPLGTTALTLTVHDGHGGNSSDSVTVLVRDTIAPVVTAPAALAVQTTQQGGATGNGSFALATFLADGSAKDAVDPAPVRLAPTASGVPVTNAFVFPLGQTAVTFSFKDSSNNVGTAVATVTVTAPAALTCDADLDGDVDANDLALVRAAAGSIMVAGDPRDANRDGAINIADTRFCQLRLTNR